MAAPVVPATSTSFLSYLNPLNLLKIPSYIYEIVARILNSMRADPAANLADRHIVVYQILQVSPGVTVLIGEPKPFEDIYAYFDQATDPYVLRDVKVLDQQGHEVILRIPGPFLTDIERCGGLDRFIINGKEVTPAPKSDEQKQKLLADMLQMAGGDEAAVTNWTSLWNSRAKFVLLNILRREILKKYGLDPSMSVTSSSVTSYKTETGDLICQFMGDSVQGTDPLLEPKSFTQDGRPIKVKYRADLSYDAANRWLEERISFVEEPLVNPEQKS